VEGSFTSLPFGDSQATASGSDTNPLHFAELDSDATGLQHATFRDYSSTQARWLRPGPSRRDGPSAFPVSKTACPEMVHFCRLELATCRFAHKSAQPRVLSGDFPFSCVLKPVKTS
jgi:hypothetical protein